MIRQGAKVGQVDRIIAAVPCVLKAGLSRVDADRLGQPFRDAGGDVEVRPDDALAAGTPPPDMNARAEVAPADPAPPDPEQDPGTLDLLPPPDLPSSAAAVPPLLAPPDLGLPLRARSSPSIAPPVADPPLPAPPPSQPPIVPSAMPTAAPLTRPPLAGAGATAAPLPTRPPAVFHHYNPWIFRGVWIGLGLIVLITFQSCYGRYKAFDRLHDFGVAIDEHLQQQMVGIARKGGVATRADLEDVVKHYAHETGVKVKILDVIEEHIEVVETAVGPDGQPRCVASSPMALDKLPMDKRMEWAEFVRTCGYPNWVVGFAANVTARVGLYSSTQYVEHWVWLWAYAP
jgi:hypothetical protein